jgi:hypothetical protein
MARFVLTVLLLLFALEWRAFCQEPSVHVSAGENSGEDNTENNTLSTVQSSPHVRIEDKRLRDVLTQASETSPTLQALIARLESSDVVAYVQYDPQPRSRTSGQLTFLSMAAGLRYVVIRVAFIGLPASQAALIGHELRHAVEVVEHTSIVDVASFDREYARIGFRSGTPPKGSVARAYETDAARRAGDQILRELRHDTD